MANTKTNSCNVQNSFSYCIILFCSEFAMSEVKKIAPHVKKYCYTSTNKPAVEKYVEINKPLVKLVTERVSYLSTKGVLIVVLHPYTIVTTEPWPSIAMCTLIFSFESVVSLPLLCSARLHQFASSTFLDRCKTYKTESINVLTPSEAENLLKRSDVTAMSPDGYWIMCFEPMGALACNAEMITQNPWTTTFVSIDAVMQRPTAISFGTCERISFGLRYRIDFYYHPDFTHESQNLFLGHFLKNLIHVNQFWKGNVNIESFHDKIFDRSEAERVLFDELGISRASYQYSENTCLLVEWPDTKKVALSSKAKAKL